MDRTTKLALFAIAAGLFANAGSGWMPVALAADEMKCTIDGPLEVRISSFSDTLDTSTKITGIDGEVEIDWDFSAPGSSSSSPLYVHGSQ